MPPGQYQAWIQNMDYPGLVAGMCKELEMYLMAKPLSP